MHVKIEKNLKVDGIPCITNRGNSSFKKIINLQVIIIINIMDDITDALATAVLTVRIPISLVKKISTWVIPKP